jgi:hypothetical protein
VDSPDSYFGGLSAANYEMEADDNAPGSRA